MGPERRSIGEAVATPGYRHLRTGVLLAFFLSGFCGLVHEVIWTRLLRHVMGNTTYAVTAVLCVFMLGLAVGGYAGGRWLSRRANPLRVFAVIEVAIGLLCLGLPAVIEAASPVYAALYGGSTSTVGFVSIRFVFSAAILFLPAALMGASLPVLTRVLTIRGGSVGKEGGTLYAVNTLGAVLGVASAGFLLIPSFGVLSTLRVAASINILIGVGSILLQRRAGFTVDDESQLAGDVMSVRSPPREAVGTALTRRLLVAYGVSGFAALVFEIAWFRVLSLLVGSSVYAFSLMLTAFILGLGIGSLVMARVVERIRAPVKVFCLAQVGIGASALVVAPLFSVLPLHVTGLFSAHAESFAGLQVITFGVSLLVMLIPTLLMGSCFPIVARVLGDAGGRPGRTVGTVYACNTIGAILGALVGGFILIAWIGLQNTIVVGVAANLFAGALLWSDRMPRSSSRISARMAVVGFSLLVPVLIAVWMPSWNPAHMSMGPFMAARRLPTKVAESPGELERMLAEGQIVFHEEGLTTTVTVREVAGGELILSVNGKPDASSVRDLETQLLLAHVPMLLHRDPQRVLVIGLASGITLASAGFHEPEILDCAEISPAVVSACALFGDSNSNVLHDERVSVIEADGRNHLALGREDYDVIISEPSNPWIAGISDLFTLEFFQLCRNRLSEGGVACIWLEAYNIDRESMRSISRTFQEVFPNSSLWRSTAFDYQLIGIKGGGQVDIDSLETRLRNPGVEGDLSKIGIRALEDVLVNQVLGPKALASFCEGARLHTDDNALLEFSAPRTLVRNEGELDFLEEMLRRRSEEFDYLLSNDSASRGEFLQGLRARGEAEAGRLGAQAHVFRARKYARTGSSQKAMAEIRQAALLDPDNEDVQASVAEGLRGAVSLQEQGRSLEAMNVYRQVLAMSGTSWRAMNALAWILATDPDDRLRRGGEAVELAEKASRLTAWQNPDVLDTLAAAYAEAGRYGEAVSTGVRALEVAEKAGRNGLCAEIRRRLELYRDASPVRDER